MIRPLTFALLALAACASEDDALPADPTPPGAATAVDPDLDDQGTAPIEPTYQLRALAHNIAGGPINRGAAVALDEMTTQIAEFSPDVVMLEEVCASQRDAFQERFPDWDVEYVPMVDAHSGCGPGPQGQLLASRWPLSDVTITPLLDPDGVKQFNLLCADVALPTRHEHDVRACVVHLRAFQDAAAIAARERQARRIRDALHDRIEVQGQAVVVGGDFNARPWFPAMDAMYRLTTGGATTGDGDFREADETDTRYFDAAEATCSATACRSGQPTIGVASKYDYVFFSHHHATGRVSGLAGALGASDHHLYRAFADLTF